MGALLPVGSCNRCIPFLTSRSSESFCNLRPAFNLQKETASFACHVIIHMKVPRYKENLITVCTCWIIWFSRQTMFHILLLKGNSSFNSLSLSLSLSTNTRCSQKYSIYLFFMNCDCLLDLIVSTFLIASTKEVHIKQFSK